MSSTTVEGLRALADPVRWTITDALRPGPRCACELVDELAIPAPLLSHHMRVLRVAGLVQARRLGRRVEYTIDLGALDDLARSVAGHARQLTAAEAGTR